MGANPDKTFNGYTALMFAIQSKCSTTINLLAPVTKVKLAIAVGWLAKEKVEMTTRELRQLVKRASAQPREAAIVGLREGFPKKYGNF